jgi:hypothetical protein
MERTSWLALEDEPAVIVIVEDQRVTKKVTQRKAREKGSQRLAQAYGCGGRMDLERTMVEWEPQQ